MARVLCLSHFLLKKVVSLGVLLGALAEEEQRLGLGLPQKGIMMAIQNCVLVRLRTSPPVLSCLWSAAFCKVTHEIVCSGWVCTGVPHGKTLWRTPRTTTAWKPSKGRAGRFSHPPLCNGDLLSEMLETCKFMFWQSSLTSALGGCREP